MLKIPLFCVCFLFCLARFLVVEGLKSGVRTIAHRLLVAMALVTEYRILLGGSNPANMASILNVIKGIDATVEVVGGPHELCRRAVAEPWSLVVSCFVSPFVGRGRLVAEMRQRGLRTPIFVLTPIGRVEVVVALLSGGVSQVMSMPVSPYRLRRKVLEVIHSQKSYHIALQRLILQSGRGRADVRYS